LGVHNWGLWLSRAVANPRHDGFNSHRRAFLHQHFAQNASGGRWNLGVNLVGRNFKEGFIPLHPVAGLLEPAGKGPFDDTLAHLGHFYVNHRVSCNCWYAISGS
jgi:hypothetical protein